MVVSRSEKLEAVGGWFGPNSTKPATRRLRGTVKAVPSGDTVLIVANAGPTVRASCIYIYIYIYIYMFLGAFVSFFFFFCRGDGVSSLFRDVFSLLFWVP